MGRQAHLPVHVSSLTHTCQPRRDEAAGKGATAGEAARTGLTIGLLPHSHRPSHMPTDPLTIPSASRPPSCYPPARRSCPPSRLAPPIRNLTSTCTPHAQPIRPRVVRPSVLPSHQRVQHLLHLTLATRAARPRTACLPPRLSV